MSRNKSLCSREECVPLKKGAISQQVRGLELVNWPSDSSMKKMGMPTKNSMMAYGMKNTAAT